MRASYQVEQKVIHRLAQGIEVGGVSYGPIIVTPIIKRDDDEHGTNEWVWVSLTEGKNREIRRVFEHFKLIVTRLIRVKYGYDLGASRCFSLDLTPLLPRPFQLDKKLEPGKL